MLHVLFLILKIIGIILAVLLGAVLFALLLVLFVPVRYRADFQAEDGFRAHGALTWLFRFLSVLADFEDGAFSVKLKVCGITIKGAAKKAAPDEDAFSAREEDERLSEHAEEAEKGTEEAKEDPPSHRESRDTKEKTGQDSSEDPDGTEASRQKKHRKKKRHFSLFQKIQNLKCTFRRICVKIKQIREKIRETKEFVLDERTKAAVRLCLGELGRLLRKLRPRKLRGELYFGMEDPALTGQILGGISIFYPFFMDNVKVIPNFEERCLAGELFIKGRLRLLTVALIAWRLWRSENIRYVYRRISG